MGTGIFIAGRNIKNSKTVCLEGAMVDISFRLKDHDGFLAVYRGNSEKPYTILDYRTNFLNEYDRQLVADGISVETEHDMRILIEDMTG